MAKLDRFEVVLEEGTAVKSPGVFRIVVDKVTGVNYLWTREAGVGGLTPLLDENGKPIMTKK